MKYWEGIELALPSFINKASDRRTDRRKDRPTKLLMDSIIWRCAHATKSYRPTAFDYPNCLGEIGLFF